MKLSYEDKVQIYELRKQGYSLEKLSNKFGINNSNLRYMIKLIDRYYSPELKQEMINKVLHEGWTKDRVSLEYGLPSRTILLNWLAKYKKNAYTIVEKTRGRVPKMGRKRKKTWEEMTELERLQEENERLRTEVDYLKKLKELEERDEALEREKQRQLDQPDKDKELKDEIQAIYNDYKGNYGYRRITLELRNRGYSVNHKKVQRLMKVLGLAARIRRKRKYSSYQGEIGKKAENLIQRQFEAAKPMEKCYTDVTEFAIPNSTQKLYLSPVLDGFNSEIIAYNLSCSPNLEQVKAMLEQAFTEKYYENTSLHSDQGWQYQHDSYHRFLESKGIQTSMSRKGDSPDNGMMESFFGILKSEMFYGYEKAFQSLKQLEQAIVDYIDYYNNKRIKVKLKGLSPMQYRTKSFA
ncbi:IS3 family transposase [Streptococcus oralis]|uniref:IS3 family transposase n=4 Tax=Streptococcus TaxID=1301 RepID=A0A7T3A029_STROR|nr:IS3 family transposase [Streptococcus oralis]QPT02394.1 IS3 family transposase [Streptococcus oralis]CAK1608004.1 IS3 family transposase [Streptococcus oralis subsp. dentisani]